jgi:hypothetical protein
MPMRTMTSRSSSTLVCFICLFSYSSTMTILSLFGSSQRVSRKHALFASAKSTATTTSITTAFVNSRPGGRSESSSGLLDHNTLYPAFQQTRIQRFSLFSEMLPRDYFTGEDNDGWQQQPAGRVFKTLGFSEEDDMAANYNPEEFEIPEGGGFLASSSLETTTMSSLEAPSEASQQKPMSELDGDDSATSLLASPPPTPAASKWDDGPNSITTNNNSHGEPKLDVTISDSQSEYPPVQRNTRPPPRFSNPVVTSSHWDSRSEEVEIDISNWHPHTGSIEPPPPPPPPVDSDDGTTTTTAKSQKGGPKSEKDGSAASSISAPLRRTTTSHDTMESARSTTPKPQPTSPSWNDNNTNGDGQDFPQQSSRSNPPPPKPQRPKSSSPVAPVTVTPAWNGSSNNQRNDSRPLNRKPTEKSEGSSPVAPPASAAAAAAWTENRNSRPDFQKSSQREFSTPSSEPTLSREDFRARFALDDSADITTRAPPPTGGEDSPPASSGGRTVPPALSASFTNHRNQDDTESMLNCEMESLEVQIGALNEGKKLNLKSYRQVSQALFGVPDKSTSKDVLEAIAHKNELAKLILEYRQASQRLSKLQNLKTKRANQAKLKTQGNMVPSSTPSTSNGISSTASSNEQQPITPTDPLMLVDASSLIYRAYYSMPPMHRFGDGMPVSAVLRFYNMLNSLVLNKMLRGERPRIILCCDSIGPTFGHEMYSEYKAHRPEAPIDLIPQFPLIYQAARAYGLVMVQARF